MTKQSFCLQSSKRPIVCSEFQEIFLFSHGLTWTISGNVTRGLEGTFTENVWSYICGIVRSHIRPPRKISVTCLLSLMFMYFGSEQVQWPPELRPSFLLFVVDIVVSIEPLLSCWLYCIDEGLDALPQRTGRHLETVLTFQSKPCSAPTNLFACIDELMALY